MDFSTFKKIPLVDSHVHFVHAERMGEIRALMGETRCDRLNLVCLPNPDGTTGNPAAVYFKECFPEQIYISGALAYAPALAHRAEMSEILAGQVRSLKARGFDGLKLIEGKPSVRKLLPIPLDGPEYDGMWAALAQEGFPVVFHVADPDEFWDPAACPDWARQSGWDYSDGTYPSKEDLYHEVDRILERYPSLRIVFAHFYFLSADLERAARFLDAHPAVCFDLTPHLDMYRDFSRHPEAARAFFLRYQDRILYGTDMDTRTLTRGQEGLAFIRSTLWLMRSFLEQDGPFALPGQPELRGIGLPDPVLEKIYHANFERLYGKPRRI